MENHAEKVYMIREVTAIQKLNMDVQAASDRLATIESGDILVTATTATSQSSTARRSKRAFTLLTLATTRSTRS